ncbi:MAG: metallophosphoesterase [Bacteroidetes bacterium]|jgi:predicted MPP superfamily phosphohydrolase|nr:metallophosphoesterase [Bacteroidota bacterium]
MNKEEADKPKTWTRRKFIRAMVWSAIGFGLLDALWIEKFFIETNEFYLGNSTDDNYDIKVLQISDLHLQSSLDYKHKRLAQKVNELKPDLIFITGDAVDYKKNITTLNKFLQLLDKDIKKVAITGNWEYWGYVDINDLNIIYNFNNCDLLINQSKQFEVRGKTISVTGVDDYVGGRADIKKALQSYSKSNYHVILNHCPQYSDAIANHLDQNTKADFILSGHTHGGQVNLFGFVPFLPQGSGDYLKGWYKDDKRNMYVLKGIGTSILPIRFMARSEIAVFHLKA